MKTFKSLILSDLKTSGNHSIAAKITSIRYRSFAGGDAVDVEIIDPTPSERLILSALCDEYENSSFCGMTDMAFPKESKKERSAKYVHANVKYSEAMTNKAKEYLKNEFMVETTEQARETFNMWLDQVIGYVLRGEGQFKKAIWA